MRIEEAEDRVVASAPSRDVGSITLWGVLGAMLLVAGIGGYLAMDNPPYRQDEASAVGYALSLREGVIPSIDTEIPEYADDEALQAAQTRPFTSPWVHVANNPPLPYLLAVPFVQASMMLDIETGPLLTVRFLNVLGAAGAVAMAYLLGRELSGRDPIVGLATAGLLAGVIAVPMLSAFAGIDGTALFATTGVMWALARYVRTRELRHATALGLWCAGAAAVRPMALVLAAAAGAIALFVGWRAAGGRIVVPLVIRLGLPTVLLAGWFYALNVYRYGDPTGSAAIFEKGGYEPRRSLLEWLLRPDAYVQPFSYLVTEVYGRNPWWLYEGARQYLIAAAGVGFVIVAVGLAYRHRREPGGGAPQPPFAPWLCVAALVPIPVVLTAQHMAGGGAGHARYLLPMLPIVAAATALVARRVSPWLPLVLVGGFVVAELSRLRAANDLQSSVHQWEHPSLTDPMVGQPFQALALLAVGAGAVLLIAALVQSIRTEPAAGP